MFLTINKICPRCNNYFECRHNDIANCHCTGVELDEQQLAFVKQNYHDCLCNSCLQTVKNDFYTMGINNKYIKH